jgi:hypothetical protein
MSKNCKQPNFVKNLKKTTNKKGMILSNTHIFKISGNKSEFFFVKIMNQMYGRLLAKGISPDKISIRGMTTTGFLTLKARASTLQDIEFATDSYYESYGVDVDMDK